MSAPPTPTQDGSQLLRRYIPLTDLPVEILSNIFIHLSPVDIAALGECNSLLQQVSDERQIWRTAFETALLENRTFLYTYSTTARSTENMKTACTRPWKLRRQIWSGKGLLDPVRVQILRPYLGVAVNAMELVPGGRFLLTTDTLRRLCLWDLGCGTDVLFSQEPLAVKQFSGPGVLGRTPLLIHPTADGEGVVCCIILSEHYRLGDVYITEIFPTSNQPQFNTIAVYQMTEDDLESVDHHNMTCDFFGYHANNELVLWAFRKKMECRVALPGMAYGVLFFHDIVLVLYDNKYYIYSIPILMASNALCEIEPISTGDFHVKFLEFSLPLTWYTAIPTHHSCHEIHVDAIVQKSRSRWSYRYTLSVSTAQSGLPSATFLQTHDAHAPDKGRCNDMKSFTMPGNEYTSVWLDGQSMNDQSIHVGVTRTGGDRNGEVKERLLYEREVSEVGSAEEEVERAWSFCPFAARICSLSFRGEIRVMDFVQ